MPVLKTYKNGKWEAIAGATGHTHKTIDITDFPSSLPADGGNADTATKATQDASGNVITSTYATKAELSNAVIPHTISQTDITAGSTPLATGELYLVYE